MTGERDDLQVCLVKGTKQIAGHPVCSNLGITTRRDSLEIVRNLFLRDQNSGVIGRQAEFIRQNDVFDRQATPARRRLFHRPRLCSNSSGNRSGSGK